MRITGWKRWLIAATATAAVAAVAGPFVYIHFVEGKAPAPLSVGTSEPSSSSPATGSADTVAGGWKVTTGSQAGYRVKEVLFGQSNVAVGRTSAIGGTITIAGTSVTAARFTVDMTSVSSDQQRRDGQFHGRIMQTSTYPTATFELTKPIALGTIPPIGQTRSAQATGMLTLHGATRTVTFTLSGKRASADELQVSGSIPVTFADYGIQNPSFGGVVQTEDHGTLEFLLVFARA